MVGSSKILTVSYGTFSCTLEGFDDSFGTMKAIAEYFRDLAADDRYFGAEPPTPDAEMLARIAEREIARRVEAHQEQGRFVLRAETPTALAAGAAAGAEAFSKGEAVPERATPEDAETSYSEETREMESPLRTGSLETSNSASARAEEYAHHLAEEETVDPEGDDETEADAKDKAEEATGDLTPADDQGRTDESVGEESFAEQVQGSDSLAAKLRMIRSVVDVSDESFALDDYEDDSFEQDFLDSAAAELEEVLSRDNALDLSLFKASSPTAETELSESLSETQEQRSEDHAQSESDPADKALGEEIAALLRTTEKRMEAADTSPDLAEEDAEFAGEDQDADTDQDPMKIVASNARLIRISRVEMTAALTEEFTEEVLVDEVEEGSWSEDDEVLSEDDEVLEDPARDLSPEEEAELQRELAVLEAEFIDHEDEVSEEAEMVLAEVEEEDVSDDVHHAAVSEPQSELDEFDDLDEEDTSDTRAMRQKGMRSFEESDSPSDLTRIFDEAKSQLEAPASTERRNAIQHLRAAVQATRAETKVGSDMRRTIDESPYRSDLDSVVRPRRPMVPPEAGRSARPGDSRPAPLKLVAEQRIDLPREPVRPRRVSASDALRVPGGTDGGFSAFAAERGAMQLPDLLEAAAAYLADVEGQAQFSRPMLMGKLKEVEQERFSREDGLRSFGQLLREGKLQKLAGGRFAVTEETEFRAQHKRQAS